MPLRISLIAAAALLSLSACNRDAETPQASQATPAGTAATLSPGDQAFADAEALLETEMEAATGQTVDEAYIARMIAHHRGAIAMADVALASSRDPGILRMAQTIKDTQTAEIAEMQAWEPAPPAPAIPPQPTEDGEATPPAPPEAG